MVVQRILATLIENKESGLPGLLDKTVAENSVDVLGAARRAQDRVAQVGSKPVRLRTRMCPPDSLRQESSARWRKGQHQEYSRKYSAAVVGIIERRIVGPECGVQDLLFQLRVRRQHKAPSMVGSALIQFEIQLADRVRIVEHDARDLPGNVAHVVPAQRPIDSTKVARPALLRMQ